MPTAAPRIPPPRSPISSSLLIRNQCVNDGTVRVRATRGKSVDLLAGYLAGVGDHEVYEPRPGRQSLVVRLEGSDPDAPTLMLMGHTDVVPVTPDGWSRRPVRRRGGSKGSCGAAAQSDMLNLTRVAGRRVSAASADSGFHAQGHASSTSRSPDEESQGVWGAELAAPAYERRTRCSPITCSPSPCGIQVPTADGVRPPGAGGREGHLLVEDPGARHAGPRLAAVPHRQRARHRGGRVVRRIAE